ncbi:MAG: TRAP transporter small permease [Rhizobiaceae bacterium]|nr:TRAP transporter small permease [Rhizobiaceae bacterium]
MSATGNVRTDSSLLSRLDQNLFKIESLLNLFAGLITLGVMFIAVGNIVGRYLGYPVPGYIDYMEQAVPAIAILGIAYCQRLGGHIRMDIVVGALKGRILWFAEFLGVLLMLLITAVLIYGSWDHAARAINLGDSTVDINLPTWPTKILFPILFAILSVRLAIHVIAYFKAMQTGESEPVGVPLIEDVAEQTKREAETVSGLEEEQGK